MDFVIRNARLPEGAPERPTVDIAFQAGRIIAIERSITAQAPSYDAEGRLACAGLVETHIHLDKSRILDRCAPQPRRTLSPVAIVAPINHTMMVEDSLARAYL